MADDKKVLIRSFDGRRSGDDDNEESDGEKMIAAIKSSIEMRNIHLVPPLAVIEKPRPSGLPAATELSGELDSIMPYGTESSICSVSELDLVMERMVKSQKQFAEYTQEQVDYIFQEVAREANMNRVQLAQYAVEDTKRGVVGKCCPCWFSVPRSEVG